MLPALARDIDEQPLLGGCDRMRHGKTGGLNQLNALFQRRTGVVFMRKDPRHHAEHLVHVGRGGVGQLQMGNCGRVETRGQDPKFAGSFPPSAIVLHHCSV